VERRALVDGESPHREIVVDATKLGRQRAAAPLVVVLDLVDVVRGEARELEDPLGGRDVVADLLVNAAEQVLDVEREARAGDAWHPEVERHLEAERARDDRREGPCGLVDRRALEALRQAVTDCGEREL
jgi:hypothetical protein